MFAMWIGKRRGVLYRSQIGFRIIAIGTPTCVGATNAGYHVYFFENLRCIGIYAVYGQKKWPSLSKRPL